MSNLKNRLELRLSDEHLRRLKCIMEAQKGSSRSDTIRGLIDHAYNKVFKNAGK